jgi:pimeloyl-ACP methyl ester carboxylesterase
MLVAAQHPRRIRALVIVDATPDVAQDGLAEMRRISLRPLRLFPDREAAARAFRLIPPETVASGARLQALALRSTRHRGHGRWSIGPDREFFRTVVPRVTWPVLPRIRCPTLILRAERSSILHRPTAEAMRRAIPSAILLEIAATCHHLVIERPAVVGQAIHDFLRS